MKKPEVHDFQIFKTNNRNFNYRKETLRITEYNFSLTDISEKDLSDTKLDQLFVCDLRRMLEILKQKELTNCHIEKLQITQRLHGQVLGTKRLLVHARENCMRKGQLLEKELKEATKVEEIETREFVVLVDEQESLPRELENSKEEIRKLRSRIKMEQTSRKFIQRRLEVNDGQRPFRCPPNFMRFGSCFRGNSH